MNEQHYDLIDTFIIDVVRRKDGTGRQKVKETLVDDTYNLQKQWSEVHSSRAKVG